MRDDTLQMVRADQVTGVDVRTGMGRIFAEGFTHWLEYFSKDKETIARAFAHAFVLDQFYLAMVGDRVAGMAACTDCRSLSMRLDNKELRRHLGWLKGSIAGQVLKKEFESPFPDPPPATGSIEFVATSAAFRGQGMAMNLIGYIIASTPYRQFLIEEVADTNTPAMNLYRKLGFQEYTSKPVPPKRAAKIGIGRFVSFRLIR